MERMATKSFRGGVFIGSAKIPTDTKRDSLLYSAFFRKCESYRGNLTCRKSNFARKVTYTGAVEN